MQYVNTVELRDQANAILHRVQKGELVIVTFRGKPCARIQAITDDDLEALVEERLLKKAVEEGLEDLAKGRTVSLKAYARGRFPSSR